MSEMPSQYSKYVSLYEHQVTDLPPVRGHQPLLGLLTVPRLRPLGEGLSSRH